VPGVPPVVGEKLSQEALAEAVQVTLLPLGLVMESCCVVAVVVPAFWLKDNEVGLATSDALLGVTVSETATVFGLPAAVAEVKVMVALYEPAARLELLTDAVTVLLPAIPLAGLTLNQDALSVAVQL